MTPEKYVKQFYPDAFCDYSKRYKAFAVAIENEGEQIIIGKSKLFERIAWQNAKNWIKEQAKKSLQQFKGGKGKDVEPKEPLIPLAVYKQQGSKTDLTNPTK